MRPKFGKAASNKEEAIITQKWINFGLYSRRRLGAKIRRTGYPQLYFPVDGGAQLLKQVPNRVKYPASERSNNTSNWNTQVQSMGGDDSYYIKLFWAKQ
jgi:hypothetical protein